MTYKITEVVAAFHQFEACVNDDEAERDSEGVGLALCKFLAERFPTLTHEDARRAHAIWHEEREFEQQEDKADLAALERDVRLCERAGLPNGSSFMDALRHLAAQGDLEAAVRLADLTSSERSSWMALFRAAVAAHPAWTEEEDGRFSRDDEGDLPKEPDALVDWFQAHHAREARRIEATHAVPPGRPT